MSSSWSREWARQQHGLSPQTPPEDDDSGGGFGLMDIVRPALSLTNKIIEAPFAATVRPASGWVYQQAANPGVLARALGIGPDIGQWLATGSTDDDMAERIRNASGVREAYEQRFQDNAVGKFIYEAGADPLNAVGGVGRLAQAARAADLANRGGNLARFNQFLDTSPAAANAMRRITTAEDKINDIQSLPFMAPVRAARWTGRKLLGGQLEQAGISEFRERMVRMSNFQKELSDKGFDPWEYAANSNDVAYLNPTKMTEALRVVDNPTGLIESMDDGLLGRTWKTASDDDAAKELLTKQLVDRGLLTAKGETTSKLDVHMQLDEIADRVGMGLDERQAMKDGIDVIAYATFEANKATMGKVANNEFGMDEFLSSDKLQQRAQDQFNSIAGMSLKSLDDVYTRMVFDTDAALGTVSDTVKQTFKKKGKERTQRTFALEPGGRVSVGIEGVEDAVPMVENMMSTFFRSMAGESTVQGLEEGIPTALGRQFDTTQGGVDKVADESAEVLGSFIGSTPEQAAMMGRLKKFSDFEHMRQGGVNAPSPAAGRAADDLLSEKTSSEWAPRNLDHMTDDAPEPTGRDFTTEQNRKYEEAYLEADAIEDPKLREKAFKKLEKRFPGVERNPAQVEADANLAKREQDIEWYRENVSPTVRQQEYPGADVRYAKDPEVSLPSDFIEETVDEIPTSIVDDTEEVTRGIYEESRERAMLSKPKATAKTQEVLDQIAFEENLPMSAATRVNEILDPIIGQNPEHFAAFNLWGNKRTRAQLARAMASGNEQEMRDAVYRGMDYIDSRWMKMGAGHPSVTKLGRLGDDIMKIIPQTARTRATQGTRAAGRSTSGSILSDSSVEFATDLRNREAIQKFQTQYDADREAVEGIIETIAKTKSGLVQPVGPTTTYRDLREAAQFGTEKQKKRVEKFLKKYNIEEENISDSLNKGYERNLIEAYQKDVAKELGVDWNKTPDGIRAMQKVAKGWRELALFTPRYHLANAMDMMVKSAIHGVNPVKPPGSAQEWTGRMGRSLPTGVRVESVEGVKENPVEFAVSTDESVLPGFVGSAMEWNSRMARTIENTFREAAFAQGARDWMKNQQWDIFEGEVRRLTGAKADDIINDLRKTQHGVSFSPEVLQQKVMDATGDVRASTELSQMWDRNITEAYEKGRELANLVHFDFGDVRKIEETLHLRAWAPFHFWATRNIPYYLDTLAANPELIRLWDEYNEYAEAETEGTPGRFGGMIPALGPADDLIDVLFGPGKTYFNPMVALSIADQTKSRYVDPDMPLAGKVLNKLQSVGLAPAPWFSQVFSAAGIYGAEDEPFNVLRHSGILKSATGAVGFDPQDRGGLDIEAPFHDVVDRIREVSTGKKVETVSGSAYRDSQLSKKLGEMSIRITGVANHPAFVAAMKDPSNPLYQRADREVQKDNLGNDVLGMTAPLSVKRYGELEETINTAKAALPEGALKDRDFKKALIASGNIAGAYESRPYPNVLEQVYQDKWGNIQSNKEEGSGSGGIYQQDTTSWGGDVWAPNAPPPFNSPAIYKEYIRYIRSNEYVAPDVFVQKYV